MIDLKKEYGKHFRIRIDESYFAETGSSTKNNRDPWYWQIPGPRGHIYLNGEETLGISIDGHPTLCRRLSRESWVLSTQHGSEGINAVFHKDDIELAFEYLKPYKRRKLSPERREKNAERLRRYAEQRKA